LFSTAIWCDGSPVQHGRGNRRDEYLRAKSVGEGRVPAQRVVRYREFGAKGDGKTDDIDAIAEAHAFANQHGLAVKADEGATYYIGGKNRTVVIQTDTDFGTAAFIIDDTDVQDRRPMFSW
jgi:hypothetical protein